MLHSYQMHRLEKAMSQLGNQMNNSPPNVEEIKCPGIKETIEYVGKLQARIDSLEKVVLEQKSLIEKECNNSAKIVKTYEKKFKQQELILKDKDAEMLWREGKIKTLQESNNEYQKKADGYTLKIEIMEQHRIQLENKNRAHNQHMALERIILEEKINSLKSVTKHLTSKNEDLQKALEKEKEQYAELEKKFNLLKHNQDEQLKEQLAKLQSQFNEIMNTFNKREPEGCSNVLLNADNSAESSMSKRGDKQEDDSLEH